MADSTAPKASTSTATHDQLPPDKYEGSPEVDSTAPANYVPPARKRGYRACLPCRNRKLKCDLGPLDNPTLGPCRRCAREVRECVFAEQSTRKRARKAQPDNIKPRPPPTDPTTVSNGGAATTPSASSQASGGVYNFTFNDSNRLMNESRDGEDSDSVSDEGEDSDERPDEKRRAGNDGRLLLSASIHNTADALRLLATASTLHTNPDKTSSTSPASEATISPNWQDWEPVSTKLVTRPEAELLLQYFREFLHPLYPILPPEVFDAPHLPSLTSSEALLLAVMVTIASRFYPHMVGERRREIHMACSQWARQEIACIMDGNNPSRNISCVESLLLFAEWPPLPIVRPHADAATLADVLRPSKQYDSLSWSYIGFAVRLAQELGIDDKAQARFSFIENDAPGGTGEWQRERILRTWLYCYSADRHVSVRLGRAAVVQAYMSSAWWEKVLGLTSHNLRLKGSVDLWGATALPQGTIAALIGTISEKMYPNKDITRAILKSGHWEGFLRSLALELQFMRRSCQHLLSRGDAEATLLQIEFDYTLLYGYSISLRALQERVRRRVKDNDLYFRSPSLLNLQEGPWLIEAVQAAQSILSLAVKVLEPGGFLMLCPARIFQRMLFAATFLFKALAVGVIEHGQPQVLSLLSSAIDALDRSSIDYDHLPQSFSALLRQLQKHYLAIVEAHTSAAAAANPTSATSSSAGPSQEGEAVVENASAGPSGSNTPLNATGSSLAHPSLFPHLSASLAQLPTHGASTPPTGSFGALPFPFKPGQSSAATPEFANMQGMGPDLSSYAWEWDPANALQVQREQDLLFASLWGNEQTSVGSNAFNLVETLCGDEFLMEQ